MTGPDRCVTVGGPCEDLTLLNHLLLVVHNLWSTDDVYVPLEQGAVVYLCLYV
jgi:hypothetical protein